MVERRNNLVANHGDERGGFYRGRLRRVKYRALSTGGCLISEMVGQWWEGGIFMH